MSDSDYIIECDVSVGLEIFASQEWGIPSWIPHAERFVLTNAVWKSGDMTNYCLRCHWHTTVVRSDLSVRLYGHQNDYEIRKEIFLQNIVFVVIIIFEK